MKSANLRLWWATILVCGVLPGACQLTASASRYVGPSSMYPSEADLYFPQFHVRPPRNWINDPNGPHRDPSTNAVHLWMQYNPDGSVWGNMTWYHMVSLDDFRTWQALGISIANDQPYDVGGAFSGSITSEGLSQPVIFYTCVDAVGTQRQCIARPAPNDPLLHRWIKDPQNPVINSFPQQDGAAFFRDPTTAFQVGGGDAVLVAFGGSISSPGTVAGRTAVVPVYSSSLTSNLSSWSFSHLLYQELEMGTGMFECPDVFKLSSVHIIKYSSMTTRTDYYRVGTIQGNTQEAKFVPLSQSSDLPLDFGTTYASKSYYDPVLGQQVMWGWVNEDGGPAATEGWSGLQTLPRGLTYDAATGRMRAFPVGPIFQLRSGSLFNSVVNSSNVVIPLLSPSAQYHLSVRVSAPTPFSEGTIATLKFRQGVEVVLERKPGAVYNFTDIPGGDYWDQPMSATATDDSNAALCGNMCDESQKCVAWTYVRKQPAATGPLLDPPPFDFSPRCSLKFTLVDDFPTKPSSCCTSGYPQGAYLSILRATSNTAGATKPLLTRTLLNTTSTGSSTQFDIFVDHSIIEVYKDQGLDVGSARVYPPTLGDTEVSVQVQANAVFTASGFTMASHWRK